MPYYAWKGVTLTGDVRTGTVFARSEKDLDAQLFDRDIALLASRHKRITWWYKFSADTHFKIQFFRQLAALLSSGIFLAEALRLMNQQAHDKPRLQEIMTGLVDAVQQGRSFHAALADYHAVFDTRMIQMARVGTDTGALGHALNALCDDLEMKRDLRARVRMAVLLPSFTFFFFLCVATILIVFVVPRLTGIFSLYGAELPRSTQRLVAISAAARSWLLPSLIMGGIGCFFMIRAYIKLPRSRDFIDPLLFHIPLIGTSIKLYAVAGTLRALALLIAHGMPLVTALRTVSGSIGNTIVRKQCFSLEQQVMAGSSMSQAMRQLHESVFDQEVIAAVRIGEESGNLALMLTRTADMYYDRLKRNLLSLTTLVNPCLTIILGLLITALIVAVYLPIFSLPSVVAF